MWMCGHIKELNLYLNVKAQTRNPEIIIYTSKIILKRLWDWDGE